MPSALRPILTKKKFSSWLKKFKKTTIIGQGGEANHCPIANYLSSKAQKKIGKLRLYETEVDGVYAKVRYETPSRDDHKVYSIQTPAWAEDFIKEVDQRYDYKHVTVSAALEILGEF